MKILSIQDEGTYSVYVARFSGKVLEPGQEEGGVLQGWLL